MKGRAIFQCPNASAAFWRWFGNSKVVGAEGLPLVVYHGTNADFSAFAMPPRAKSMAAYFSDSPAYANFYTRGPMLDGSGGNVMPVYLSIKTPYRVRDDWAPAEWPSEPNERRSLIRRGHDGIVWTDPESGEAMWIAFRPEQIKSAIGNKGTFSPLSPSIID